ncbi:MAG: amidohydrolase family protein, partial [Gemmatimonadales bacterium]
MLLGLAARPLLAQSPAPDTAMYRTTHWRNIGPFRGGRSLAFAGVPSQPHTFCVGHTGGGVWETEDGGETWRNVSDRFLKTGSSQLALEDAVHRMTGLPALSMGVTDRGVIAPGVYADLVLFDPATVLDQATMEEPRKPAVGIRSVWVNGQAVYE